MDDLIYSSATKLSKLINNKKISSKELVRMYLDRIEKVNPVLNAVVQLAEERALKEAEKADSDLAKGVSHGLLHGLPFTLKDSIDSEGIITTGGTMGRKDFMPDKDSTVAARLRNSGGILLGKTNTPELTLAGETDNLVYGRTNNPYNFDRMPGGSSGGAAAIICSGGTSFDIGSDTGGSIRGPSHYCGITGIKPNSGRVPRTGHIVPYGLGPIDSLTQNGPMARRVEDLSLILPIISGPDSLDPFVIPAPLGDPNDVDISTLRVCVYSNNGIGTPTPETVQAVESAAKALSDVVGPVTEDVPKVIAENPDISNDLTSGDGRAWARRALKKWGTTDIHPWLQRRLDKANPLSVGDYTAMLERVDRFRSSMLAFMKDYDIIICPVAAFPALPHGESLEDKNAAGVSYTNTYNITGWPSTVVRAGTSPDGLPIGVQIVSRPWREDISLAVASHLESILGGWQKPPI